MEASAQKLVTNDLDKRLTSSPVVGSLGSFGGLDIKKSTGALTKNIPLFNVKEGSVNYNPSIEYFSTGVRINEWGARLGISWRDNFTAVIQRTVRSVPDEMATSRPLVTPEYFNELNADNLAYLRTISNSITNSSGVDPEYDIFSYNIFGEAGDFIIKDNQALLLNHTKQLKIEVLSINPYTFLVTKNDGMKYYFGINSEIEYCHNNNENLCDESAPYIPQTATAWFLSKIVSPSKDILNFNYGNLSYEYVNDYNESAQLYQEGLVVGADEFKYIPQFNHCSRMKFTSTKYLQSVVGDDFRVQFTYKPSPRNDIYNEKLYDKITLLNKNEKVLSQVVFQYDEVISTSFVESQLQNSLISPDLITNLKTRYFLKSVTVSDPSSLSNQTFSFSYLNKEQLPHRFSFSQDLLGYYNGKPNAGFIPNQAVSILPESFAGSAVRNIFHPYVVTGNRDIDGIYSGYGLLNKIVYPTGGYDEITYEPNSYSINEVDSTETTIGPIHFDSGSDYAQTETPIINVPFKQKVKITVFTGYNDINGYPYDNDGSMNWVELSQSGNFIKAMKLFEQYDYYIDLEPGVNFKMLFELYGTKTNIDYIITYKSASNSNLVENQYFGQRVQKVVTNPIYGPSIIKKYDYHSFDKVEDELIYGNTISSIYTPIDDKGIVSHEFISDIAWIGNVTGVAHLNDVFKINGHYSYNLSLFGGAPLIYSNITEFMDDETRSFIASEFMVNPDLEGKTILKQFPNNFGISFNTYSPVYPVSNSGWNNGLESARYYGSRIANRFSVKKQQEWFYDLGLSSYLAVNNYLVHTTFKENGGLNITSYETSGLPHPFTVLHYPMYQRWHRLSRMTETDYFRNQGALSVINKQFSYEYNNLDKEISKESFLDSKDRLTETIIKRPAAKVLNGEDPTGIYQLMVNSNLLSPVIEEIAVKNSQITDFKRTNYYQPYNGIYVPQSVDVRNTLTGLDEMRLRYDAYDNKGNLLSISNQEGIKTNYLWSYNSQYPIAEIKNADYATIESLLGGVAALASFSSSNPSDAQVNAFLAPLRSNLPQAQITTYTYDPLVGMTSQTDAKGQTIYYEYDAFQRLQNIKDQNGNIIKNFDYHYKP